MNIENVEMKDQLMYRRQQLIKYIGDIDESRDENLHNNKLLMQVSGEQTDSNLRMNSNYYQYILWIFLMIMIVMLTIAAFSSDNKNVSGIAYVIISIFVLLLLVSIYKRFSNISITY